MRFNLFDTVKLKEPLPVSTGAIAPVTAVGVVVEILNQGEAYLVEILGDWVKYDAQENLKPANSEDHDSFRETIGVVPLILNKSV